MHGGLRKYHSNKCLNKVPLNNDSDNFTSRFLLNKASLNNINNFTSWFLLNRVYHNNTSRFILNNNNNNSNTHSSNTCFLNRCLNSSLHKASPTIRHPSKDCHQFNS